MNLFLKIFTNGWTFFFSSCTLYFNEFNWLLSILFYICHVVSRLQYHFQPAASGPHAIFMQKDANGESYVAPPTQQNPLYVPSTNPCQSTMPAQHQQQQPQQLHSQQQQHHPQQQFHMLRLQGNPPSSQNNELSSNNQTMHIKQLHTATVHGKRHRFAFHFTL